MTTPTKEQIGRLLGEWFACSEDQEPEHRDRILDGLDSLYTALAEAQAESLEQARLLGMSGSREADLLARLKAAERDAEGWKLEAGLNLETALAGERKP